MVGMDDLVAWLRAQLDEDERVAKAADSGRWLPEGKGISFEFYADEFPDGEAWAYLVADTKANQWHITNWAPARVLAEVEAKREILESAAVLDDWDGGNPYMAARIIRALALPYADRDGYRAEWRPDTPT